MPDNWIVADENSSEESPGSVKTQCQLTTGEGDFRDSAREINRLIKARVKRRGKSSPVLVTKNARQTPLGARLNREDTVIYHKKQSLVSSLG